MSRTSEGRARIEVLVVGSILLVDSDPSVSALDALMALEPCIFLCILHRYQECNKAGSSRGAAFARFTIDKLGSYASFCNRSMF